MTTKTEWQARYALYVAACARNGVAPLYSFATWLLARTQF